MISKIKGTQDLLDLTLKNFILEQTKKFLDRYNFSEIETPILEPTKLFIRSLGQDTDVVSKEMYIFDKEKKDSACLRPEATASTMRAFLENHIQQKPWKVFCHGPMFRHERPQKGRFRQFSQINIEIINSDSIAQDAQFIKTLDNLFGEVFKIEDFIIKLNFLGCTKDRKNHKEELNKYLEQIKTKICNTCQIRKEKNILRIFDCKIETCKKLYQKAPKLTDYLCEECKSEWKQLQETLKILSVSFVHDPFLVRGLDYYNKTVFEFSSKKLGAQDAFCGGGRYALGKILEADEDYPSIGTAIGLERLTLLVEENQNKLSIPQKQALHLIIPMSKKQEILVLLLSEELISNNLCSDILLATQSIKSAMRKANKMGAKYVLILGEDEQKNETVSIKNMTTGKSEIIKQAQAVKFLNK